MTTHYKIIAEPYYVDFQGGRHRPSGSFAVGDVVSLTEGEAADKVGDVWVSAARDGVETYINLAVLAEFDPDAPPTPAPTIRADVLTEVLNSIPNMEPVIVEALVALAVQRSAT